MVWSGGTMSITSDEVNFLVYRYLLESGFQHSAYTFGLESHIHQTSINGTLIPPGALIAVLQKGLQYVEAEVSVTEDGTILEEKDVPPLSLIDAVIHPSLSQRPTQTKVETSGGEGEVTSGGTGGTPREGGGGDEGGGEGGGGGGENVNKKEEGGEPMEVDRHGVAATPTSLSLPPSKVMVLKGHQSEVFTCSWNPKDDIIVSGSGDSTARLWRLREDGTHEPPLVLPHEPVGGAAHKGNRDVTTVHWNSDGSLLATGSYDGVARVWTMEGELKSTLIQHSGPIFALKWNGKGNYIATGGVDKTAVVWDVHSGEVKQQFAFHKAPTLDVDWQSTNCFASCSSDRLIHVCKLGADRPTRTFQGHKNGVNVVKWDPSGTLLASCSDDHTAKIWSLKQDSCLHDFKDHSGDIYTLQWSPTGPGSPNPSAPLLLATASFDSTVKLWEMEKGSCLYTLRKHVDPVYSVAFSPDGRLLASGSFDQWLYIWSTQDGSLLKQYKGSSGIFEVCWSQRGHKLAASLSNNTVCVLDLREL